MTIGPEPITSTALGCQSASASTCLFHLVEKLLEQVVRVVRPGRRLRDGTAPRRSACRCGASPSMVPSYRFRCVTRGVGRQRIGIDAEAMVLRGDLDGARIELLHRMVAAAMAELQLVGLGAEREAHQLVPEADAEHRHVGVDQLLHAVDRVRDGGRIAGTVAEKDAVRLPRQHVRRRRRRGKHADRAAVRRQPAEDVQLDAEIVGGHLQRPLGAAQRRDAKAGLAHFIGERGLEVVRLRARHVLHEVGALHVRDAASPLDQLLRIDRSGRDDAAHHAARAQLLGERAGVDVADRDDVVAREVVAQRALGAPVARHRRGIAHHEPGHLRLRRLVVGAGHAVIADLRRGHRDDLARVRRIGQHFLVTGHAGVEHHFAAGFARGAGRHALEPRAVFQCQNCVHSLSCTLNDAAARARSPATTRTVVENGWYPLQGQRNAVFAGRDRVEAQRRGAARPAVDRHGRAGRPRLDRERAGRGRCGRRLAGPPSLARGGASFGADAAWQLPRRAALRATVTAARWSARRAGLRRCSRGARSTTVRDPSSRSRNASGVTPRGTPSTVTVAPLGLERTNKRPAL